MIYSYSGYKTKHGTGNLSPDSQLNIECQFIATVLCFDFMLFFHFPKKTLIEKASKKYL